MGKSIELTCKKCGKIYHAKNGCGMSHARLEAVINNFNSIDRVEIEKIGKSSLFPVFQFEYKTGYCKLCNHIVSVPVLNFHKDGKEFFGVCEVCGHNLTKKSVTDIQCPACNHDQWDIIADGFWD